MCSSSEAGSCLRLINFAYHSTLGLRVIKKKRRGADRQMAQERSPKEREGEREREKDRERV